MKNFTIPMKYEVYTFIRVEADTIEDALKVINERCKDNEGDLMYDVLRNKKWEEIENLSINNDEELIKSWNE